MAFHPSNPQPMRRLIDKLIRPVLKKRGFAALNIHTDWPSIIGDKWAEVTIPEKLTFKPNQRQNGILYLRVQGSAAVLLQHIEPEIIERVNTYFGYKAVAHLKMLQGFSQVQEKLPTPPSSPSPERKAQVHALLKEIDDGPLKDALIQLGLALER